MSFNPSNSAIPLASDNRVLGHHATMSMSESVRTHSTEESSVSTPVLDTFAPENNGDGVGGEVDLTELPVQGATGFRW